jgi:hypothetical protein
VITPEDLDGMSYEQTESNCNIPCYYTWSRHHDLKLSESHREELANRLANHARKVSPKIRQNRLKPFLDKALVDGCYSVCESSTACAGCDPGGQNIPR